MESEPLRWLADKKTSYRRSDVGIVELESQVGLVLKFFARWPRGRCEALIVTRHSRIVQPHVMNITCGVSPELPLELYLSQMSHTRAPRRHRSSINPCTPPLRRQVSLILPPCGSCRASLIDILIMCHLGARAKAVTNVTFVTLCKNEQSGKRHQ